VFESFLDDWSRLPVKSLGLQIGLSKRCALDITAGYGVSSSAAVRGVAVSEIVGEDERALSAFAASAETFGNIERQWTRPRGAFVAIADRSPAWESGNEDNILVTLRKSGYCGPSASIHGYARADPLWRSWRLP